MADKRLIISIFDTEAAAEEAAAAIQDSGAVVDDAVGVLVLDDKGKLKDHKVGDTTGGKGALAGAVFGLLGPVGLGVGIIGGAVAGHFHHKSLRLDEADRERIGAQLRDGKAAVALLAEPAELVAAESILVDLGGRTETHEFDEAVLREAAESGSA